MRLQARVMMMSTKTRNYFSQDEWRIYMEPSSPHDTMRHKVEFLVRALAYVGEAFLGNFSWIFGKRLPKRHGNKFPFTNRAISMIVYSCTYAQAYVKHTAHVRVLGNSAVGLIAEKKDGQACKSIMSTTHYITDLNLASSAPSSPLLGITDCSSATTFTRRDGSASRHRRRQSCACLFSAFSVRSNTMSAAALAGWPSESHAIPRRNRAFSVLQI
jgi:hypothetical protein